MKNTQLIVPDLGDFTVTVQPSAQQAKEAALAVAADFKLVPTNATEQADCIAAASMCKSLVKGMEATREAVKAPVLEAGRTIDSTAKAYSGALDAEVKRLEGLAAKYQARLIAEAALARAEEEARQKRIADELERQRQEELREARQREQERNAARLRDLEAIQAAKDEEERQRAQQAADEAAEARARQVREEELQRAEMVEQQMEQLREGTTALAALAPAKAEDARTTVKMDYEMIDIAALWKIRPDLVRMTEERAKILTAINVPGQPLLPGIRVFESVKVQANV